MRQVRCAFEHLFVEPQRGMCLRLLMPASEAMRAGGEAKGAAGGGEGGEGGAATEGEAAQGLPVPVARVDQRWEAAAGGLRHGARLQLLARVEARALPPVVRAALVGVMYEALIAGIVGPALTGLIEGFQQQAEQMERAREQAEQCVERKGASALRRPGGVAWP